MRIQFCTFFCAATFAFTPWCLGETLQDDTTRGDKLVTEYFLQQTQLLTDLAFSEIDSLEDWTSRRDEYRRQLLEMLGLDPLPEKTPLVPTITGTVESEDLIVERLHFQSMPGLYVTGNLYRPKQQDKPLPAILYVCGHGGEWKNGVSLGNKTHYQHHGAWFARNGYVCLTIDTIQLGEIEGIHHGTYREKMWWWNNRGHTPAGVEAWNCVRSLDYLQSRDEVDGERMGVTGRSGGGAYSWWIAAIDERIKVAVPVAGITSLHNHVVEGTVEGHCDCMFMVNTYRWDYPMVAALVAPRPLLISNTDKDRIFPLEGVIDVHAKIRRIYELYDAGDKLGLQITEGPHKDTQELRVAAFRWFNRFLRQDESLIETNATPLFEKEQLRVFDELPDDERVTTIHESFVPKVSADSLPASEDEIGNASEKWMKELREHCFRGWPQEPEDLDVQVVAAFKVEGMEVRQIEFTSQTPYRLTMFVVSQHQKAAEREPLKVHVLSQDEWEESASRLWLERPPGSEPILDTQKEILDRSRGLTAFIIPRGVGPTQWSRDEKKQTQIRRRFMQLGQTVATMQIYDVRRALQSLSQVDDLQGRPRSIHAKGEAAVWALYAALFESEINELTLTNLPSRNRDAPDLLNVSRFVEIPHVVQMATHRVGKVTLLSDDASASNQ